MPNGQLLMSSIAEQAFFSCYNESLLFLEQHIHPQEVTSVMVLPHLFSPVWQPNLEAHLFTLISPKQVMHCIGGFPEILLGTGAHQTLYNQHHTPK